MTGTKLNIRHYILLGGLYCIAYYLWFGYQPLLEFRTSDETLDYFFTLSVMKRSTLLFPLRGSIISGLLSHPHGAGPTFMVPYILLLNFFKVPFSAFTLKLPVYLISAALPVIIFFLGKKFLSIRTSFFCSIFVIFWPFSLYSSRTQTCGDYLFLSVLFLSCLLLLYRYLSSQSKLNMFLLSISLTFYLNFSLTSLSFIPVMFYAFFLFCNEKKSTFIARVKKLLSIITRKELWVLPALSFVPYLLAFLYGRICIGDNATSYFGKLFSRSKTPYFFDLSYFINKYFFDYVGVAFTLFLALGFFYGAHSLFKKKKESILFVCSLCNFFPYGYLLGMKDYVGWVFLGDGLYCLIFLSFLLIERIFERRAFFLNIFMCSLMLLVFLGALSFLSPRLNLKLISPQKIDQRQSAGRAAAGFYVRKTIGLEKNIFTDMEPIQANYYFGREGLFNAYDASVKENVAYFKEVKSGIDYAIVSSINEKEYDFESNGFCKEAQILKGSEPVISVFMHGSCPKTAVLDSSFYDKNFYNEFANLTNIVPKKMSPIQPDKRRL